MNEEFRSRLVSTLENTVQAWDHDPNLLRECRQSIIQSKFYIDYQQQLQNEKHYMQQHGLQQNDTCTRLSTKYFMQQFVKYFQNHVMIWYHPPKCHICCRSNSDDDDIKTKSTTTAATTTTTTVEYIRTRGPISSDEIEGKANRVEVYQCSICNTEYTFPRYNNVQTLYNISKHLNDDTKLPITKTPGRCGEYTNVFGLYCRALGLHTRYILDYTDHVWIEILLLLPIHEEYENNHPTTTIMTPATTTTTTTTIIPNHQLPPFEWCMLDPCEGIMNEYSMYEYGWGKSLNYCIAISSNMYMIDVTTKYTRQYNTTEFQLRRRQITTSEYYSTQIIYEINQNYIWNNNNIKSSKEKTYIQQQYQMEMDYLQYLSTFTSWSSTSTPTTTNNNNTNHWLLYQMGRISGSNEWKALRNENGKNNTQNHINNSTVTNNNITDTNFNNNSNNCKNHYESEYNTTVSTTTTSTATTTNTNSCKNTNSEMTMMILQQQQQRYPWLGRIDMAYNTSYHYHYDSDDDNKFEIYLRPPVVISNSHQNDNNSSSNTSTKDNSKPNDDTTKLVTAITTTTTTIRINHVICATCTTVYNNNTSSSSSSSSPPQQQQQQQQQLSIVVMDENFSSSSSSSSQIGGCILQSIVCTTIPHCIQFLSSIPPQRIIIIVGSFNNIMNTNMSDVLPSKERDDILIDLESAEEKLKLLLGEQFNLKYVYNDGIIYMGQLLVTKQPDWSYCGSYTMTPNGIKFVISRTPLSNNGISSSNLADNNQLYPVHHNGNEEVGRYRLKTFRNTCPQTIVGRVPDTIMTLSEQLVAGYAKKHTAFISFLKQIQDRTTPSPKPADASNTTNIGNSIKSANITTFAQSYYGYTTKNGAPIYLLGPSSYPLVPCCHPPGQMRETDKYSTTNGIHKNKDYWNTFLVLPAELVPENDNGLLDDNSNESSSVKSSPQYDIPIDQEFFQQELGSHLLLSSPSSGQESCRLPTKDALHNVRLVAYYFSAHWCGPCRSFTPILAEMYTTLKDAHPYHGLEIVFVSSDRDEDSFNRYFSSMPWLSVPYSHLPSCKQALSLKYNVRGIPSLVVVDSMSGQVVISNTESRALVQQTCQGGTDESICAMFTTHWLNKTPVDSQQLLELLAMSNIEVTKSSTDVQPAIEFCNYLVSTSFMVKQERIEMAAAQLIEDCIDETEAYEMAEQAVELSMIDCEENIIESCLDGLFERIVISYISAEGYASKSSSEIAEQISKRNGSEQLNSVLTMIFKYFNNCFEEPWNPRYRKFQLSFKAADNIVKVDGSIRLMLSIGFEISCTTEDYIAYIPIPMDLDQMKRTITSLRTQFNESNTI